MSRSNGAWGSGDREEEDALLAALVELHRKKHRKTRAEAGDNPYARVLEHFERRGKRLRGEHLVTEELIGRAFEGVRALAPAPVQQELEITGPVGASAAGRFRVQNRAARRVLIEWVVSEPLEGPRPSLRFDPPSLELATGEAAMVRVTADLAVWRDPGSCTVAVEGRAEGRRDRLWLTITAFREGETREDTRKRR